MKKILKFSTSWCGPCKQLSEVIKTANIEYPIAEIDLTDDNAPAKEYGIRGVPTLVMLDNGKEVKRKSGMMTKEQLEEWVNG